jgi:hypothetical protein
VIAVFADQGVDHDLVASQALLDDSGRQRRRDHALFLAGFTRTLLAFADSLRTLEYRYAWHVCLMGAE